ncbi:hypothetical protein UA08_04515 [Talaromyces atroroseus]|uniref:Nuclear distribution protein nudF n=1 Tax=Talaromyces atroroseus TaxID=1441469 RepID=A0A225AZW8_TALAT|nr:hypothetical protein UA08_04515 [Talaromyces atroroseus]OKL60015.1 hypothetical protein UA08_04515 [Talaromyces atroroseus]
MAPLLTDRQAGELHKSMIAYLLANGLSDTATALRKEVNLGEDVFDTTTAKKYEGMLEKKWTSIARLQKKIMDLESMNNTLQSELDNTTPASRLRTNQDLNSWLPSTARYSLQSHRDKVNCIAFHPIFSSIASGSDDYTIKIWDWDVGELERTLKGHTRAVRGIDYGGPHDKVLLASCSSDLTIKLWDPADDYKNIRTLQGHDHIVNAVRFTPSGDFLISASRDTDIRIWAVTNGYCIKTISGHTGWVRDICLSHDGKFLLSTGHDNTARLWNISTISSPELRQTMMGHENFIDCCAIAPPASYEFLAPLAKLQKQTSINGADFIATGSRDNTIKLWDARGTCLMTLVGHDSWIESLVFHPGGKYLLSASDDRTLRCWDLSQLGKCVKTIVAHEGFVTCLKWAPGNAKKVLIDGDAFQKGEGDGEMRCLVATGSWDRKQSILFMNATCVFPRVCLASILYDHFKYTGQIFTVNNAAQVDELEACHTDMITLLWHGTHPHFESSFWLRATLPSIRHRLLSNMLQSDMHENITHQADSVPANPPGNEQNRNVFEEIHAEEDVLQFIGSANKNPTTAKSIHAKTHATQCFGDMADSTFQQVSSNRSGNVERGLPQQNSAKPGTYGEVHRLGSNSDDEGKKYSS